ncbi:MAG: hypothetical protein KJO55_02725, partial [Gammaproteobacteria bacterium]|nr:hypothetical protein [Gammaproteobacteria bacterium]
MPVRAIRLSAVTALVMTLLLSACEQPPQQAPVEEVISTDLPTGYWQAAITLPGGEIDTGIEISE